MGYGGYSFESRSVRTAAYASKSAGEIFTSRSLNNAMDPCGVTLRESRDSDDHPKSVPIVLALDVTGSMGSIPLHLIKEGLPHFMDGIIQKGVKDPQILFLGIGDHECDSAPLQVGQFESSDDLLDHWLENIWIESGGGGNSGESYMLAWYFAGNHTSIDSLEKRGEKGFLFTIGDEPVLPEVPKRALKSIMGDGQYDDIPSTVLLDKAREKYDCYHLHVKQGSNGQSQSVMDGWKQLMGKNLILVDNSKDIPRIMTDIITTKKPGKAVLQETDAAPAKEDEPVEEML